MPKVSIKVLRGDGSTYETVADVTDEAAKELLKRDDTKRGESKGSISTDPEKDTEDKDAQDRIAGALTDEERKTVRRGSRTAETTSRKATETRKKSSRRRSK